MTKPETFSTSQPSKDQPLRKQSTRGALCLVTPTWRKGQEERDKRKNTARRSGKNCLCHHNSCNSYLLRHSAGRPAISRTYCVFPLLSDNIRLYPDSLANSSHRSHLFGKHVHTPTNCTSFAQHWLPTESCSHTLWHPASNWQPGCPIKLEPLENGTPTQTTTRNQLSVKTAVSAKWQRLRPFYHLSQKYKCS